MKGGAWKVSLRDHRHTPPVGMPGEECNSGQHTCIDSLFVVRDPSRSLSLTFSINFFLKFANVREYSGHQRFLLFMAFSFRASLVLSRGLLIPTAFSSELLHVYDQMKKLQTPKGHVLTF